MSVNKAIIVGNLGKDPEVRYLEGGIAVASFSVATSESYKDRNSGERVKQTEWHNVVLWRGLAEVAEKYLKKGSQVYIEGKLRTRSWDDQAGQKRYTTEIVGDNMTMLGSRDSSGAINTPMPTSEPSKVSTSSTAAAPVEAKVEPVAKPKETPVNPETPSTPEELDDLPF